MAKADERDELAIQKIIEASSKRFFAEWGKQPVEPDDEEKQFWELRKQYEERFGESICVPEPSCLGFGDMIPIIQHCLEANTPYKPEPLPDGCIA